MLSRTDIGMAILLISWVGAPATTSLSAPRPPPERIVTFVWNSPARGSVVSYKIYWGTENGHYQHVREIKAGLKTTLRLASNTKYYVAVSACNKAGESRLSNQVVIPAAGR
jgi:hypothetical protein